jgi:hypothetical protein
MTWVDAPLDPNPHSVTRQLEQAIGAYTGAPYVVTTTSCTQAILMALAWQIPQSSRLERLNELDPGEPRRIFEHRVDAHRLRQSYRCDVSMPRLSYAGVPAAIRNAGGRPMFRDEDWQGEYQLAPFGVWDSARRFTGGMYRPGAMQCVSFHATKILADTQGGAILLDDPEADRWLRRARFDGRTEGADSKTDQVQYPSWHAYLSPDVAARLLWKLSGLPRHNPDLPRSDYPDLSTLKAFQ